MPPTVVVDTNVFIAAILSPSGQNREVIRACLQGKALPIMGSALFHEYEDLLSREDLMAKSPVDSRDRQKLFAAFLSVTEWIKVYLLWRPNLPDEGDNHLIELALAGNAETIVTHNFKNLTHGELRFPDLKIQPPSEFLKSMP